MFPVNRTPGSNPIDQSQSSPPATQAASAASNNASTQGTVPNAPARSSTMPPGRPSIPLLRGYQATQLRTSQMDRNMPAPSNVAAGDGHNFHTHLQSTHARPAQIEHSTQSAQKKIPWNKRIAIGKDGKPLLNKCGEPLTRSAQWKQKQIVMGEDSKPLLNNFGNPLTRYTLKRRLQRQEILIEKQVSPTPFNGSPTEPHLGNAEFLTEILTSPNPYQALEAALHPEDLNYFNEARHCDAAWPIEAHPSPTPFYTAPTSPPAEVMSYVTAPTSPPAEVMSFATAPTSPPAEVMSFATAPTSPPLR